MEFRALGPLTVLRDGDEVDIGPLRQRAVLALLLMHRNEVVTTDRILEEIWGEDRDGRLNALRVHISRIRNALDPGHRRGESSVLETVGDGYRLNVEPDRFDVNEFDAELASARARCEGDREGARTEIERALGRWRGEPYEDFPYEDFAQTERRRLVDARADALELRIETDLWCGRAGAVLSELEVLREQHPLRERFVEQQARAFYLSGRSSDALRSIDRYRRYIADELGLDPSPTLLRLEEQILLHDGRIQPRAAGGRDEPAGSRTSNPYQGLRPFGTDDAGRFFGRDALTADILRIIRQGQRLVTVVGASGTGKSSLVRAGVVPALAKGAIEGSDRWLVATMVPGAHPFVELNGALGRATLEPTPEQTKRTAEDDHWLLTAAIGALPDESSRLVLVIDQFEELFTLVDDPAVRTAFLSNLVHALEDVHQRIIVVVALRADFYAEPLAHPAFGARLGPGVVNVTALTAEELGVAARLPAEQIGVTLEPALLGQLIGDVGSHPAALPLFQYALTELYDRRAGDVLTLASYRSFGGLDGALRRRADDLLDDLDQVQRAATRQLFLRLVLVVDDGACVRRRIAAREVLSLDVDSAALEHVIDVFGRHRILSFDSDQLTGSPTVEIAHEALLTAWPTLERWVAESRDDLRRHAALTMAVREWQLSDRDPAYLWGSARVSELDAWLAASDFDLNAMEQEFVTTSRSEAAHLLAEDDQRRRAASRSRRLLAVTVGVLAVALAAVGAVVLGVFAGGDEPVVAYFGDRDRGLWHANAAGGLDRSAADLGIELVQAPLAADPWQELRELAESGPDIIITDTFGILSNPTLIEQFPDIEFGVIGDPGIDGATTMTIANEQGGFLAGIAAASVTRTGVVGFIGAARLPEIELFQAGFEAGAKSVDTDVDVVATYIIQSDENRLTGFSNPSVAASRATALFDRDVDVVFVAAGNSATGVFDILPDETVERERSLWVIGVDLDRGPSAALQRHLLGEIVTHGDAAATRLVERMLAGDTLDARIGVADGALEWIGSDDHLSRRERTRVSGVVDDVANGDIAIRRTPGRVLLLDGGGNEVASVGDIPNRMINTLTPDASGAAATGRTPQPDRVGAIAGDDGAGPLPLGEVTSLPDGSRIDFLVEHCPPDVDGCYRDFSFVHPPDVADAAVAAEVSSAGRPFYVRHGFPSENDEPLGPGFDVVLYAMPMTDDASDFGGEQVGPTTRYTSDYVVRGTSSQCGPTYREREPVTCEWFVHEFPDGLPYGRWAIWADWEAPCSAWVEYEFIDECADPNEVMSLFSSGGDNPFF